MAIIPGHTHTINRATSCLKTVPAAAVAPQTNRAARCIKVNEPSPTLEPTLAPAPVTVTAPVVAPVSAPALAPVLAPVSTPHVIDPDRARACMVQANPGYVSDPAPHVIDPDRARACMVQVTPSPTPEAATIRVDAIATPPEVPHRVPAMGVCVPVCDVVAETLYKTATTEAIKIVCPNCNRDIVLINPSEIGHCPFCGARLHTLAVTPVSGKALLVEE